MEKLFDTPTFVALLRIWDTLALAAPFVLFIFAVVHASLAVSGEVLIATDAFKAIFYLIVGIFVLIAYPESEEG